MSRRGAATVLHQRHRCWHRTDTGHRTGIALVLALAAILLLIGVRDLHPLLLQLEALHAGQAVGALGALHIAQPVALGAHAVDADLGVEVRHRGDLIVGNYQIDAIVHKAAQQALDLGKGLYPTQVLPIHIDNLVAQAKTSIPSRN